MLDSRDVSLLRDDVEANCRVWQELCKREGLNVLVVSTVRDDEYQAYLYEQGRSRPGAIVTNGKQPTFHWNKAGLAFDFCKNVKGHEYDDPFFFNRAAKIAKQMGFSWGGDWKSFPDVPHLQWDAYGKYTSSMVRSMNFPPPMPLYEEDTMTKEDVIKIIEEYEKEKSKKTASGWAKTAWEKAKRKGIFDGTSPQGYSTREQIAVILDRLGLI
jgi:hypothetical protein